MSLVELQIDRKKRQEYYQREKFSDFIMPVAYDDENKIYILRDGRIGFAFECHPLYGAGEDTVRLIESLLSLNMPDDTVIQFILHCSNFIEPIIDSFKSLRKDDDPYAKIVSDFLLDHKDKPFFIDVPSTLKDIRLYFTVSFKHSIESDRDRKELEFLYSSIKSILDSMYIFPRDLTPKDLLWFYYLVFNPNHPRNITPKYDRNEYIFKQAIMNDTEFFVSNRFLKYDEAPNGEITYGTSVTIKQFPANVYITDSYDFIGDVFKNNLNFSVPFILSFSIIKPNQMKKETVIKAKANFMEKQVIGSRLLRQLIKRKDDMVWVVDRMTDRKQIVEGYLVWWFYGNDRDEVQSNVNRLRDLLDLLGYTVQQNIWSINMHNFLSCTPFNYDLDTERTVIRMARSMFAFNAANLAPVQSDWKGTGTPTVYLFSRRGQLISFDLFDSSVGYGALLAAMTGAGKSNFISHIIWSYHSRPDIANIWIIDFGESQKNTCKALQGEYIDFADENREYIFNPFTYFDPQNDMSMVLSFYLKMACSDTKPTDIEKSIMENAVVNSWERYGAKSCPDTVIEELDRIAASSEEPAKSTASALKVKLYSYSSKGVHGKHFNGVNTLDLHINKLVVLELKHLESNQDLMKLVLMGLLFTVAKKVFREGEVGKKKKKLLIFDESWRFFEDPEIAKFIEKAYRTFRKEDGATITVTQGLEDYDKNESTRTIKQQAAFWLLLQQREESIYALQKSETTVLSEWEFELLKSVRTRQGKYSEVFISSPSGKGVGRLIFDKKLYWVYTTKPEEVSKREKLIEQYGFEKGIEKCVELSEVSAG